MEIFDIVVKICKEHNIDYSLCGGSVVGAYLYKGFLPWDDDIDLMMTRDNYNRFLNIAKDNLPKGFSISNYNNSDRYSTFNYTKIINDNTTFVQANGIITGIFLDITVYDKVPNGWMKHIDLFLYKRAMTINRGKKIGNNLKNRVRNLLLSTILSNRKRYLVFFQKTVEFIGRHTNDYSYRELFGAYYYVNMIPYNHSIFENYSTIEFEGREAMIVNDFINYLHTRYNRSNFRETKDKQIPSHYKFIDFQLPYKEYIKKKITPIMKQLSIILPVYNVEKYILPCLNSLYSQNMNEDDYEIIIVNDGSKDHSMEIIDDISKQHNNIIIINQENQGVSIARNNGLKRACGEYVLFVDSDDILITEKLPDLIKSAITSKADLIVADYKKMNDDDILQYHKSPEIDYGGNIIIEKKGWALYVEDFDPHECYIWRILIRREFLSRNNISFTPNIFYEDIPFTHTCYIKANKCLMTNYLLYIYRIGHTSITSRLDKKTGMDFGTAISKSWDLLNTNSLPQIVKQKLKDNIFISLSALLYGIIHEVQQKTERKEILHHLLLYTPDIYFSHGVKQRLVSFMIKKMPYLYIETRVVYAKFIKGNTR